MASASQTTHAYPKRKRAEVKYYESDDSDGYISDDEEPTKKVRCSCAPMAATASHLTVVLETHGPKRKACPHKEASP